MSLFSKIIKDKPLESLDKKLEKLTASIPVKLNIQSDETIKGNIVDTVFSDSKKMPENEINKIITNISVPTERSNRYALYTEMVRAVPIVRKILDVYFDNITQKNPITGECLLYKDKPQLDETDENIQRKENSEKIAKSVINYFDIVDLLRHKIIPKTLTYGDYFLEVVNVTKEFNDQFKNKDQQRYVTPPTQTTSLLTESEVASLENDLKVGSAQTIDRGLERIADQLFEVSNYDDDDLNYYNGIKNKIISEDLVNNNNSTNIEQNYSNILIKTHDPNNIVILETRYGSTLGYVEIIKSERNQEYNTTQAFNVLVSRIVSPTAHYKQNTDEMVNKLITMMINKFIKSSEVNTYANRIDFKKLASGNSELHTYLKKIVLENGIQSNKATRLKARFIPVSKVIHFQISSLSTDYLPYGQSIFDNLILPAKLYLLSQLTNTITKLSRASIIRKWKVDVGPLQSQTQLLQQLRRDTYNTRITLNDLGSFKSIPKILSDCKDMYLMTRNGNSAIDVELQNMGDPSLKVADLEDARKELIALSGVPAPYLGYNEVIELRDQLSHINITFATSIIEYQYVFNKGLNTLIDKICMECGLQYKNSDYKELALIPPIILILQLLESTVSSVNNVINSLNGMQIVSDPYYLLKQYIPHMDWDAFKQASDLYTMEKETKDGMKNTVANDPGEGM